jgi:hypothetical protein
MTTADEEKNKEQELEEEHKLAKETIEDLDAEEEARDVKGGSQGENTRARDCQGLTATCGC